MSRSREAQPIVPQAKQVLRGPLVERRSVDLDVVGSHGPLERDLRNPLDLFGRDLAQIAEEVPEVPIDAITPVLELGKDPAPFEVGQLAVAGGQELPKVLIDHLSFPWPAAGQQASASRKSVPSPISDKNRTKHYTTKKSLCQGSCGNIVLC